MNKKLTSLALVLTAIAFACSPVYATETGANIAKTFDNLPSVSTDNTNVDAELVMSVDVSGSVEPDELRAQRTGYFNALISEEFLSHATKGRHRAIAIYYAEWGAYHIRDTGWHVIHDVTSANRFGTMIKTLPTVKGGSTGITNALIWARDQLDNNNFESWFRIIDISGDGVNNFGPPVSYGRAVALRGGRTTINGLPLMIPGQEHVRDLDKHYANCIIGGPGGFMEIVRSTDEFNEKIKRKLVRETAFINNANREIQVATLDRPVFATDSIRKRSGRNWNALDCDADYQPQED